MQQKICSRRPSQPVCQSRTATSATRRQHVAHLEATVVVALLAGGVIGVLGKASSGAAASWVDGAATTVVLGVLGSSTSFLASMPFLLSFFFF